jgi:branched-chain amino acid transport system substrate-binding protein
VAEKEINDSGGINGRTIQLVVEDAKSSPKDAVSSFQKLAEVNGLRIIIGDVLSGTTLAIAPLAEKKKILLLAPGASNPSLRNAGEYIFRNWVSDDFDGKAMADYMFDNGIRNTFLLFQQTDYCVGLADAFEREFGSRGGKLDGKEGFLTEASEFRANLVKVQNSNTKVVYLVGEARQNGTILREAKELGLALQWFANLTVDTPECRKIAEDALEGVVYTTPTFDAESADPQIQRFTREFEAQNHEKPEITSGVAYDALMILASIIRKEGMDVETVKSALQKVKDFPGVTGQTTFDEKGDVKKPIFVKEIKGGQSIKLKTYNP